MQKIKSIQVLGSDCPRCLELLSRVKKVASNLKIEAEIEKKNDIQRLIDIGLSSAPALLINNEVVLEGKVPGLEELELIFDAYQNDDTFASCSGSCQNCSCH